MEGDAKIGALRQLLNERCSGSEFKDDNLKNLVDAGYETEADLKAATIECLTSTLPGRYGKVDVLLKIFGATAGREKGSTSEPVSTVVENIFSKLDLMSALMQESLSRTRAASTINVDDLRILRSCLDTAPLLEDEDVPLSSLLGAETEGGESFWDEDTYELQLKDEYIWQFRKMTGSWDIVWTDANGTKIKKRFSSLEFPVVAKNDLLASLKCFRSLVCVGAILGGGNKEEIVVEGIA